MVEGAGLCFEVDCTSVMQSGLVWVLTANELQSVAHSLHVNSLCPAK